MATEFDLTDTAELESHDGESIAHLATKVRNASPEFDGSHSQDDVVRVVLQDYLGELSEASEEASELQQSTRERLGLEEVAEARDDVDDATDDSETEAEAKQAEIRNSILE